MSEVVILQDPKDALTGLRIPIDEFEVGTVHNQPSYSLQDQGWYFNGCIHKFKTGDFFSVEKSRATNFVYDPTA